MGKYHGGRGQGERDWVRDGGEGKAGGASGQDGPAKGSSGGACTITLRVSCPLEKKMHNINVEREVLLGGQN